MFFHMYKYRLKTLFNQKEEFFWILLFPIILGTFFFLAFADITKKNETFETINIAVVKENTEAEVFFDAMMESLTVTDDENSEPFFNAQYVNLEEATELLNDGEVIGIIQLKDGIPSVTINENGIKETMLKTAMDQYTQTVTVLTSVTPDKIEQVVEAMDRNVSHIKEQALSKGNADNVLDYFYSLLAMACMFGTMSGQICASHVKANLSAVGMRKSLSSRSRFALVMGDFAAAYTLHIVANTALVVYLKYILKINLGIDFLPMLLISFIGTLIALSLGVLTGSIPKLSDNAKMGINVAISLVTSFLSGLMVGGVKQSIERVAPILNRLNPATLISDALYSLNVYDTYNVFFNRLAIMGGMSLVFFIIAFFITRREKYDSI